MITKLIHYKNKTIKTKSQCIKGKPRKNIEEKKGDSKRQKEVNKVL